MKSAQPFITALVLCHMLETAALCASNTDKSAVSVVVDQAGYKRFSIAGNPFNPVGANYIHQHVGQPYQSFDMFDTGVFDAEIFDRDMAAIAASGFNYVRIWLKGLELDEGWHLGPHVISDLYVDRLVNALQIAQKHGLRVSLNGRFRAGVWLPRNYLPDNRPLGESQGMNQLLFETDLAVSLGAFYRDLLVKLQSHDAKLIDQIFYVDLYSELQFNLAELPLSRTAGKFNYAGVLYDLGNQSSRQLLMDNAVKNWFLLVSKPMREVAPHLLLTVGTFLNFAFGHDRFDGGAVSKAGVMPYYPPRTSALLAGGADLIDIHVYPSSGFNKSIEHIFAANEIYLDTARQVPLLIGEFGAAKAKFPAGLSEAVPALLAAEQAFCKFHYSGLAVWTWNIAGDTWTLAEEDEYRKIIPKTMLCSD